MEKITQCSCTNPGFCQRHNINKNPHYFHLCQTNEKYFNLWESCRGMGQEFTDCAKSSDTREPIKLPEKKQCSACANQAKINQEALKEEVSQEQLKENLPSLWDQAKSLTQSVVTHVTTGMKKTGEELYQERLGICEECPLLIRDSMRCGKCGCFVRAKAKMDSAKCPEGKW